MASKIPGFTPEQLQNPAFVRANAAAIRAAHRAAAEAEREELESLVVLGFTAAQLSDPAWLRANAEKLRLAVAAHVENNSEPTKLPLVLPPRLKDPKWVREHRAEIEAAAKAGRLRP